MVTQDRSQPTAVGQFDQPVNDAPTVWSPVDVIAQSNNSVLGAGLDCFDEGVERRRTAVDVTDGDGARVHGGDGILTGSRMTPFY